MDKININWCFMKNKCLIFSFIILFFNCHGKDNVEYYFNRLININTRETFPPIDLDGIEYIHNKYYKKLYNMNKKINCYLLEKAYSTKPTNWYFYPFYFQMTEGDIAIKLLLDINLLNDSEFYKIIPEKINDEYNKSNGYANIWWIYLHKNIENRKEIIELIKETIIEK
jgi:hypothetical protein